MKKLTVVLFSLLLASVLFACSSVEPEVGEGPTLRPETVMGFWEAKGASFAYLSLSDGGSFQTQNSAGRELHSGAFLVEGDYVVLDGYGVDDPDRFLALAYHAEDDSLSGELNGVSITLVRSSGARIDDEPDFEAWYGSYTSDIGRVVIGRGASEGTALVAVSPAEGSTLSTSIFFDSDEAAYCDLFNLTLEGSVLTLEGLERESLWVTGSYMKEST